MANGEVIAFNIAAFLCALLVLEKGADKFIDHTAIIAKRLGISQSVVALLTAGAEWEELAVVVISIIRHRSSLAIGNIVGSAISNIIGAFSLGLLLHKKDLTGGPLFDNSSKIYTSLLLALTGLTAGLLGFAHQIYWQALGGVFIGLFGLYIASIAYLIAKGWSTPPDELSDSDSCSESGSDSDSASSHSNNGTLERGSIEPSRRLSAMLEENLPMQPASLEDRADQQDMEVRSFPIRNSETSTREEAGLEPDISATIPLLHAQPSTPVKPQAFQALSGKSLKHKNLTTKRVTKKHAPARSLAYHFLILALGFVAVILSSYVLSNAATNLVDQWHASDVLFGVVILSIATTIPEKFVACLSGLKGHMGIMIANTVGSNIFLLTLCLGILWVSTNGRYEEASVNTAEIGVLLGCSIAMTATVWLGERWARLIGGLMLASYVAFIVLEFTIIRPS